MAKRRFRDEAAIEQHVVDEAKARWGLEQIKLNLRGNRGWPDRIFWIPGGRPFLIEFKQPGEPPDALQEIVHRFLRDVGYDIEVHDDAELALQALARAVEAAQLPAEGNAVPPRARRRRPVS